MYGDGYDETYSGWHFTGWTDNEPSCSTAETDTMLHVSYTSI